MLCRLPPFFFSGPFPPFSGPFGGVRFALCQDSPQFVTARALEKGAQFTFLKVPVAFPPSSSLRSCPVRRPCFRYPAGPASVPLAPCAAPRLLLPLVFCRQAYGPCLSSSFRLAPFALAHQRPHSMGFSIALGSAQSLPWSLCRLPDRHGCRPGWLPFKRRGNWSAWRNHYGRKHPSPPRLGLLGRRPGLPDLLRFK